VQSRVRQHGVCCLIHCSFRGPLSFENFLITFERIKRLLKREAARKRYSRGLRKRQVKKAADKAFKEAAFKSGAGNRHNIEFNRFGDEFPHSDAPRLVVIDGQLVDMNQTYTYSTVGLLERLPDVPELQLAYLQWRHREYERQFGVDGPPEGFVAVFASSFMSAAG